MNDSKLAFLDRLLLSTIAVSSLLPLIPYALN